MATTKKGETRQKIIEAAYRLIAKYGYDKASVSKICDEVGITKPSVYYYFDSKEDIFLAILDDMYASRSYDEQFKDVTSIPEFKSRLFALGHSIISGFHDDQERHNVLAEIDLQSTRIPALANLKASLDSEMVDSFDSILKKGKQIGAFGEHFDTSIAAQTLFILSAGMSQTVSNREEIDEDAVWDWTIERLLPTE